MKTLLASLRCFPVFALFAVVGCAPEDVPWEERDQQQEDPLGDTLDLASYILPSCSGRSPANQVGSERFSTIPIGVSGGMGRFLVMKSQSGEGFEEWAVDDDFFYIRSDTTWAYQPFGSSDWCDTQCGDSNQYACLHRWIPAEEQQGHGAFAYTIYHEPGNTSVPARWLPRRVELGFGQEQVYSVDIGIRAERRVDCSSCESNFASPSVTRSVMIRRHESYGGFSDVVEVEVLPGPGAGERYYYAKGRGWIGFNGNVASQDTAPSDANAVSPCGSSFAEGDICFITDAGGGDGGGDDPALADVVIDELRWTPSSPAPGETVKLVARIRNQGAAATADVVGVGFQIDGVGYTDWWAVESNFAPGETRDITMWASWTATPGGHTARAHVDDINRFAESDEGNNVREAHIEVSGGGDGGGGGCPCHGDVDNVCFYSPGERAACGAPEGGCASSDDWVNGWYKHQEACN